MTTLHAPSRRHVLLASGTLFAWAYLPKLARAEGRDPRFLTIVLRGALDGLAAVAPVGDPDWVSLRGDDALTLGGKTPALKLDDFFALNPAMPSLHRMFAEKEAIVVHAAATSYRERSHFDGQDVLESGVERPGATKTGWLNRLLVGLAPEDRLGANGNRVFAVGPVTPLVVRGPAPVLSWSPRQILSASDDTIMRLLALYRHTDPAFARVLEGRSALGALVQEGAVEREAHGANYRSERRSIARLFRRGCRRRREVLGATGRSARRRARARRLGHALQRGHRRWPAGATPRRARRRARRGEGQYGTGQPSRSR